MEETAAAEVGDFVEVVWYLVKLLAKDAGAYLKPEEGTQLWFTALMTKLSSIMEEAAQKSISLLCSEDRIAGLAGADDEEEGDSQLEELVDEPVADKPDAVPASVAQGTSLVVSMQHFFHTTPPL